MLGLFAGNGYKDYLLELDVWTGYRDRMQKGLDFWTGCRDWMQGQDAGSGCRDWMQGLDAETGLRDWMQGLDVGLNAGTGSWDYIFALHLSRTRQSMNCE